MSLSTNTWLDTWKQKQKVKAKVEMQPHCATKCKKPIHIRSLKIWNAKIKPEQK